LNDCCDPKANLEGLRQVFISDYRPLLDAARVYNQTDDFKADIKSRHHVECIIAAITCHNGGRRACRQGQKKADFQARMNAITFNIKRWLRVLSVSQAAPALASA